MPADLVLDVSATTDGLRACQDGILDACTRSKLPRETISRLQIVLEELFTNTIKYGYRGDCERPVRLRLRCAPPIELVYEDAAPPFDPTAWRENPPVRDDVGRKGIVLVLGLAESVRYQRLPEGNRLTLRFLTPSTGAP
ncbi:MAG TPA: ATP-binding protein [Myxococcota bacterium]|jgi:anti-sigma regulatory factor (Ser/Thr protein kinase)